MLKETINKLGETMIKVTQKEMEEFVDSLDNNNLESVMKFFDSMPKLRHVVNIVNPKTKVKSEVVLEGLQSFLD